MNTLSSFGENLSELIYEKGISAESFAKDVGIATTEIYRYLRKEYIPNTGNLCKIADYFRCSLDFLVGLAPFREETFRRTPPFPPRFQSLLRERKLTRYRLSKETGISLNCLDSWFRGEFLPSLANALKLAQYLNYSLDFLFGRE